MTITIPAKDFTRCVLSVLACAGDDMTVPSLAVVNVSWDYDRVLFMATDRYVAAEHQLPMPDADRAHGAISIPRDTIKRALAVIKATTPENVTINNIAHTVLGIPFRGVGEFPKIATLFDKAFATFAAVESILWDPAKLAQLAGPKVKGRYSPLRVQFTGAAKPMLVTRQGDHDFRGLLMPCREAGENRAAA